MGFGVRGTPPALSLSAEELEFNDWVRAWHRSHTVSNLPAIAAVRARFLMNDSWATGAFGAALAGLALLMLPPAIAALLCGTVFSVFVACLLYASASWWTAYYLELQPILGFLTAAGAAGMTRWLFERFPRTLNHSSARPVAVNSGVTSRSPSTGLAFGLVAASIVATGLAEIPAVRREMPAQRKYHESFALSLATLPVKPAIVFVRYAPGHSFHDSLVENEPDLAKASVWVVHDRGTENSRLLATAPNRAAYLYREWRDTNGLHTRIDPLDALTDASTSARVARGER